MIANGVAIVLKVSLWSITLSLKFRSMKKVVRLCPGGSNQYPERIFDFLKSFLNFGFCGFDFIEMLTMELSGVDF